MDRPNICFINTDQQTWDAISAYGNPWLHTPNIDRLAEQGHNFMRAYSTDPVCAPARSSWATGLFSSETGVPFNGGHMHADIPDLGQLLRAGGYRACHAGKWHVEGRDVRESFETLSFGKRAIGAGGAEFYDPVTTRAALDFLAHQDGSRPFFLQIGLVNPHDVCECGHAHVYTAIPDPVALGLLDADDLPPLPKSFRYDKCETVVQQVMRRGEDPIIHAPIMRAAASWDECRWRTLAWQLYRFVEQVDAEIGLILDALAASPVADGTLIIFSVDHGEAAGRHAMIQKFTLYEESIRTPFIVAELGSRFGIRKGRRDHEHLISGVDLLPTVLDYAGIKPPIHCRGRSLRPLVEGRDVDWREQAYVEGNVWGRALVGRRWKYITEYRPRVGEVTPPGPEPSRLGREQLFDLDGDPEETCNLAGLPEHAGLLAARRAALLAQEARLHRRPLATDGARACMDDWGRRVLDGWRSGGMNGR